MPTSQPVKPRIGMGAVSAEITKTMPSPASKILGKINAMNGTLSVAAITPMPCPAPRALETISQASPNKTICGRDIAATDSHIAGRGEPKFGHRRQVTYKATNPQLRMAKSNGRSRMNIENLYPEGGG